MIYWIQAEGGGPVKIGYTKLSPTSRLRELQCGNPFKLVVRHVESGDLSAERRLHEEYAAYRLTGEWFAPAPALCRRGRCSPDRGDVARLVASARRQGYAAGAADAQNGLLTADFESALARIAETAAMLAVTDQASRRLFRELTVGLRRTSVDALSRPTALPSA